MSTKLSQWQGKFSLPLPEFCQMCKYIYLLCQRAGRGIPIEHAGNTSKDTVLDRSDLEFMEIEVCVGWLVIEQYIQTKGQPLNQH